MTKMWEVTGIELSILNNSSRKAYNPAFDGREGRKEQKSATRYSPLAAGGLPYFES